MGASKTTGPLCSSRESQPIDTGTLAKVLSPLPRPVCEESRIARERHERAARLAAARQAVDSLLRMCREPKGRLTAADHEAAAKRLGVELAVIQAVAEVEAPKGAFDQHGRSTILFERHYFHRLTGGMHSILSPVDLKSHSAISSKTSGGYGTFSTQYAKLEEAYGLDASAALKSASWGKFQIMGDNFAKAGFESVEEMVASLMTSERAQLDAFVTFLVSDELLLDALRKKDWKRFAARYNGPRYAENRYDQNLKEAYEKALKSAAKQSEPGKAAPTVTISPPH